MESTAFKFSSSCLGPLAYGLLGEVGKVKTEHDSFMPLFTNVIKPFVGVYLPSKEESIVCNSRPFLCIHSSNRGKKSSYHIPNIYSPEADHIFMLLLP